MAINAAAILKAVEQLIDGKIGTVRVVGTSQLERGHGPFPYQALSKPRYELSFETMGQHEQSPVAAIGSHRLDQLQINIEVHHKFRSRIQEDKRREVVANALYHADIIKQAVAFPNNLAATSSGTATNIVSGMLLQVDRDVVAEDWDAGELVTMISGTAIIRVTQATS